MKSRVLIIIGIVAITTSIDISESFAQEFDFEVIEPQLMPDDIADESSNPLCTSGPSPGDNFVLFDCKWVEIPYGWNCENGKWQEDPSILKLGPEPQPDCPRIGICTCIDEYNFYNQTSQRCYSSPYSPESYLVMCEEYTQLEFDGWRFNEKYCNWTPNVDPYTNDESLRLASEKIDVGGLGIDPVFDASTIIIGIIIGLGSASGLIFYWRKTK